MQELKIYIDNPKQVEEKLTSLGAIFTQELHVTDIYYNQPEGMVLKLTQDERGYFITHLQAENGGFKFLRQDKIDNGDNLKKELEAKYGIKCTLTKQRIFYDWKGYNVNLNLFDDIGNFLIVEGETVTKDVVEKELEFANPQYLTVSFDTLKMQRKG